MLSIGWRVEPDLERLKSSCGYLPLADGPDAVVIEGVRGGSETAEADELFLFRLAAQRGCSAHPGGAPGSVMLDAASCVSRTEDNIVVNKAGLHELAKRLGPLFGVSTVESVGDWASACLMADLAVTLQQLANGMKSLGTEGALINLQKRRMVNPATGENYVFFDLFRPVRPSYLDRLGGHPAGERASASAWGKSFVRHYSLDDRHFYVFLLSSSSLKDQPRGIEIASFAMGHEMTRDEYDAVVALLETSALGDLGTAVNPDTWLDIGGGASECDGSGLLCSEDLIGGVSERLCEEDRAAIECMVKALVAVHLAKDAHVDPFQADEASGYITFDSLLSWMWFDFSKCLDVAKIGYCQECGKPYSLVGHRGIDKVFCCAECKTRAKNRRAKTLRDSVRKDYINGKSVSQIAISRLAGGERDEDRVRNYLKSWPRLKRELEDSVRAEGWRSPLLERCQIEGLLPTLLSRPAIKILKSCGPIRNNL